MTWPEKWYSKNVFQTWNDRGYLRVWRPDGMRGWCGIQGFQYLPPVRRHDRPWLASQRPAVSIGVSFHFSEENVQKNRWNTKKFQLFLTTMVLFVKIYAVSLPLVHTDWPVVESILTSGESWLHHTILLGLSATAEQSGAFCIFGIFPLFKYFKMSQYTSDPHLVYRITVMYCKYWLQFKIVFFSFP